jgi:hypothetical protein
MPEPNALLRCFADTETRGKQRKADRSLPRGYLSNGTQRLSDANEERRDATSMFIYAAAAERLRCTFVLSGSDRGWSGVRRARLGSSRSNHSNTVSSHRRWLSHYGRVLLVPIPAKATHTAHASAHAHAHSTLLGGKHARQRDSWHRSSDQR